MSNHQAVTSERGIYGQRRSRSADTTWREEFERIMRLSSRERALLALRLGRRERAFRSALSGAAESRREPD